MATVDNPLSDIRVGSSVDTAGKFSATVLEPESQITDMVAEYDDEKTMRGQSDLLYTTGMNQASASMSGSYGLSGLAKLTGSVSAYWGTSSAQRSQTTSIVLEVLIRAGFETISFDELSPAMLMAAMRTGPRQSATKVLNHYSELVQQLKGACLSDTLSQSGNDAHKAVRDAYAKWAASAEDFRKNYGEGMVVGVVWGGIGRSELTIEDTGRANSWKYGGAAEFTYAGASSSVSLGTTYDASGSSSISNVTVHCTTSTSGACAKGYTDAWAAAFQDKAFSAVAKMQPLDTPPLTVSAKLPEPPTFIKPQADSDVAGKIETVKKDDLEALAKITAYDRFKAVYEKTRKTDDPEVLR